MGWMINFCAPFIDNDYSLRLNRGVQLSVLVFLLLVYVANYVQIYLKEKSEKDLEEQTEGVSKPSCDKNQQNISQQMKSFMASFVICYGNLAIVVSQSIMYSPYIEQSIAIVFYFFLAMLSLCQNKQIPILSSILSSLMALTILFILATSVLQIVLADYNTETGKCFIEEYVSPY